MPLFYLAMLLFSRSGVVRRVVDRDQAPQNHISIKTWATFLMVNPDTFHMRASCESAGRPTQYFNSEHQGFTHESANDIYEDVPRFMNQKKDANTAFLFLHVITCGVSQPSWVTLYRLSNHFSCDRLLWWMTTLQ
jgi:hypothetical protein